MASCDQAKLGMSVARNYYSCDICGAKTFYDANLNYEHDTMRGGYYLELVGDIKCICEECAKTHTIEIVAKEKRDE